MAQSMAQICSICFESMNCSVNCGYYWAVFYFAFAQHIRRFVYLAHINMQHPHKYGYTLSNVIWPLPNKFLTTRVDENLFSFTFSIVHFVYFLHFCKENLAPLLSVVVEVTYTHGRFFPRLCMYVCKLLADSPNRWLAWFCVETMAMNFN